MATDKELLTRLGTLEDVCAITQKQAYLCRRVLKSHWADSRQFARNVILQGFCSDRQEEALCHIITKTRIHSATRSGGSGSYNKDTLNYADHHELTDITGWQGESL